MQGIKKESVERTLPDSKESFDEETMDALKDQFENAIEAGDIATVRTLLDSLPDPASFINNPQTALLHDATDSGNILMMRLLLQYGADPNLQDYQGIFLLQKPVYDEERSNAQNYAIMRVLLDTGANPNVISRGGAILHSAVLKGKTELIRLLLQYGANPNFTDANGQTALYYALDLENEFLNEEEIGENDFNIAEQYVHPITPLLLQYGANPNLPDASGVLPIRYALDSGNNLLAEMLLIPRQRVKERVALIAKGHQSTGGFLNRLPTDAVWIIIAFAVETRIFTVQQLERMGNAMLSLFPARDDAKLLPGPVRTIPFFRSEDKPFLPLTGSSTRMMLSAVGKSVEAKIPLSRSHSYSHTKPRFLSGSVSGRSSFSSSSSAMSYSGFSFPQMSHARFFGAASRQSSFSSSAAVLRSSLSSTCTRPTVPDEKTPSLFNEVRNVLDKAYPPLPQYQHMRKVHLSQLAEYQSHLSTHGLTKPLQDELQRMLTTLEIAFAKHQNVKPDEIPPLHISRL